MWIFDRAACFPYLHPSFFSSLLPLASILYQISGIFPLGVESPATEAEFDCPALLYFLTHFKHRNVPQKQIHPLRLTACTWGWLFDPSFANLTSPTDHETLSSHARPPRSHRKPSLVTQWSVQPWRGPLLRSHGRLAQGLTQPCELYFLTSSSCPEAHDALTQHPENVSKFIFTCPDNKKQK